MPDTKTPIAKPAEKHWLVRHAEEDPLYRLERNISDMTFGAFTGLLDFPKSIQLTGFPRLARAAKEAERIVEERLAQEARREDREHSAQLRELTGAGA